MPLSKQDVALAVLAASEGVFTIGLFCPSIMTMDAFARSPQQVKMIRRGAWIAGGFAAVIGVAVSIVAENWLPLLFSVGGWAAAYGVYEYTIQHGTGNGPIGQQSPAAAAVPSRPGYFAAAA